jgi:hypothetical protein
MSKRALYNDEAKRLYVYDGYSLSQLEDYFKDRVSARTLWSWKEKGKWDDLRAKHEQNQTDVKGMVVNLAKIALQQAIDNPDPQNIYAAMSAVGRIGQKNFLEIMDSLNSSKQEDEVEKPTMEGAMAMLKEVLIGK